VPIIKSAEQRGLIIWESALSRSSAEASAGEGVRGSAAVARIAHTSSAGINCGDYTRNGLCAPDRISHLPHTQTPIKCIKIKRYEISVCLMSAHSSLGIENGRIKSGSVIANWMPKVNRLYFSALNVCLYCMAFPGISVQLVAASLEKL
jgi:hypothetical protein